MHNYPHFKLVVHNVFPNIKANINKSINDPKSKYFLKGFLVTKLF